MPTLRQLEYLSAVADTRHFGRAAAAVNVSQPTLSQQLKALEARLGVTLIERGDTPVQLTPIGREIAARARNVLLGVTDLRELAQRSVTGLAGTVRFGVTPTLGPYLLPPVVARLHRAYPDMRLHMREGIPDEQLAQLRRGALDMVLAPLPISGTDLHIEPLFREPAVVQAYYAHLRDLVEGPFSQRSFDALVDSSTGGWIPQSLQLSIKAFMAARRDDILSQISAPLSAASAPPVVDGFPTTTDPTTAVTGTFDAFRARSVTVNGQPADLAFRSGTWYAGPPIDTLVASNADWKYLDDGSDQGEAWRAPGFDDSAWATGRP